VTVSARTKGAPKMSAAKAIIAVNPRIGMLAITKSYLVGVSGEIIDLPQGIKSQARIVFLCGGVLLFGGVQYTR
jgi:hypothetical protein